LEKVKDTCVDKKENKYPDGWTVKFWDIITKKLAYLSILEIVLSIRRNSFERKYNPEMDINDYEKKKSMHEKCRAEDKLNELILKADKAQASERSTIEREIKESKAKLEEKEQILEHEIRGYQQKKDIFREKTYTIIELFVTFHVFFAIAAYILFFNFLTNEHIILLYAIPIYGSLRIFEIINKQSRVILFDTIGTEAVKLKSPRRSIILLFYNVFEMILWFANTLMAVCILDESITTKSFVHLSDVYRWDDFIKCSTLQFTTFGDSYTGISQVITQQNILANIAFWEILVGFIIIVIALARMFSLLPPVKSYAFDEEKGE
jgi:hypothetical protein